jgi:hypothetical protein
MALYIEARTERPGCVVLCSVGTYSFKEPVIYGELRPLRSGHDKAREEPEMDPA